jgi:NTE family protein
LPVAKPPRVGLVLGGGGARGGAHLGVLEVLEELRVPIAASRHRAWARSWAAPTAAGVAPAEIVDLGRKTDGNAMFDDSAGARRSTSAGKELDDRFYSGLELGVSHEGVKFREGAVAGEKLKLFFNRWCASTSATARSSTCACRSRSSPRHRHRASAVAIRSGNLTSRCAPACRCRG